MLTIWHEYLVLSMGIYGRIFFGQRKK